MTHRNNRKRTIDRGRRPRRRVGGILAGSVIAATACASSADVADDPPADPAPAPAERVTRVVLEAIDYAFLDFFGNLDLDLVQAEAVGPGDAAAEHIADLILDLGDLPDYAGDVDLVADGVGGVTTGGDGPGLYGGTPGHQVCDIDQLADFLSGTDHAGHARAWSGVLGVEPDDIRTYLDTLTPVRLRFDTRVTNHGYDDGQATPYQAVLQAGTAVLVDDTGVPRVKCNCGNPLTEPEPVDGEHRQGLEAVTENPDDGWDRLDHGQVVTVEPAPTPLDDLLLVDIDDGLLFERPVGSHGDRDRAGSGDLTATLEWPEVGNVYMQVTGPDGVTVSYLNPEPDGTGGRLDLGGLDEERFCQEMGPGGPPRIAWPPGAAPAGTYTIEVHRRVEVNSADGVFCDGTYTLTIDTDQATDVHTDRVDQWTETDTYTVTVG